jgi:hypothetical protein
LKPKDGGELLPAVQQGSLSEPVGLGLVQVDSDLMSVDSGPMQAESISMSVGVVLR